MLKGSTRRHRPNTAPGTWGSGSAQRVRGAYRAERRRVSFSGVALPTQKGSNQGVNSCSAKQGAIENLHIRRPTDIKTVQHQSTPCCHTGTPTWHVTGAHQSSDRKIHIGSIPFVWLSRPVVTADGALCRRFVVLRALALCRVTGLVFLLRKVKLL